VAKKIFSVILIVIGSLFLFVFILSGINSKGPDSDEPAFMFGYYLAYFMFLVVGAGLILLGIRMRRRIRKKKIEKEFLDTLPGLTE